MPQTFKQHRWRPCRNAPLRRLVFRRGFAGRRRDSVFQDFPQLLCPVPRHVALVLRCLSLEPLQRQREH